MTRGITNRVHPVPAIAPQVVTGATTIVSSTIDRLGYDSAMFIVQLGTLAATTVAGTIALFHGSASDMSDETAVTGDELIGATSTLTFTQADDDKTRKVGYAGSKRYIRIKVTPTSNNANLPISAVAVLGNANSEPPPNPPQ